MVRRSASSAPRFSGRRADAIVGDQRVEVAEQLGGVLHHLLERQVGDPLQHALHRGGDARQVGRHARDHRVRLRLEVERRGRRIRNLDQLHLQRLGDQAGGREPGAQPQRHLRLEGIERGGGGIGRVVRDADAAWRNGEGGAQRHLRPAGVVDDRRLQRFDLADLQPAEPDRRTRLQPADRALEQGVDEHPLARRLVEEVLPGRRLGRIEVVDVPRLDRGRVRADGVEGDAALQQRDEAVDVERGAARADLDGEAAGVPEAGAFGQPLVVGRVDEGVDRHVAGGGQLDVLDAPDLDALEEHRGADGERATGRGAELHAEAGLVGGGQRLARQALEPLDAGPDLVVPGGADVDARRARSRCR